MEIAEAIDSLSREKLSTDGDQHHGEHSRSGSSSLLWRWTEPPSMAQQPAGKDEGRSRRASPLYLICLTISTGGLQVIWTAIMSQGSVHLPLFSSAFLSSLLPYSFLSLRAPLKILIVTSHNTQPYLSSLGLPPYLISLVWLAGPFSGTFVQPCIGVLSDRSQHPWGRRKPFIITGTFATMVCLLALPRAAETIAVLSSFLNTHIEGHVASVVNRLLASAWIWALNISIQPLQVGIRALIVDGCPPSQQMQANSYASCIICLGTVLGYASGFVSLPNTLPWLGNTQFKGLCVVASVALGLTVAVTCLVVKEKRFVTNDKVQNSRFGVFAVFWQILATAKSMPRKVRTVCMVQFFAWISWFPFLFYATTYIGNLYQAEALSTIIHPSHLQTPFVLHPDSVRQGTLAMTLFAITALATNLLLPLLVCYPSTPVATSILCSQSSTTSSNLETIENEGSAPGTVTEQDVYSPPSLKSLLAIPWFTLPHAWTASHTLTSVILLSTALTRSRIPSTLLVGLLGVSWALTQWAPFALISAEIAGENSRPRITTSAGCDEDRDQEDADDESLQLQAGTIMGVHNMAIATPQIVAAVGSSALFWVLGRWGVVDGEAIGWVLRVGGLASFVAAWLSVGIEEQ